MKLSTHIKPKTNIWKIFPKIISSKTAQCIYPFIFLPENVYNDLKSSNPNPESFALLLHEQTHLERQKKYGILWFIKYLFSAKYRFNEELLAFKKQVSHLKKYNLNLDLETRAKRLSSWLYLWCITYKKALEELEKL